MTDNTEDGTFTALLGDALRAVEGQHAHEMDLASELDRILLENDNQLRDALAGALNRRRMRRQLIASHVADAVFEIVGEPPPKIIQDHRQTANYDRTADPLKIYGDDAQ